MTRTIQTTKITKLGVEMLFKEKYPELQDVEYKMGITKGQCKWAANFILINCAIDF